MRQTAALLSLVIPAVWCCALVAALEPEGASCVMPRDDLLIESDVRLCPSDEPYLIEDRGEPGVLIVRGTGFEVDATGVTIRGNGQGTGVMLAGPLSDVELRGLALEEFTIGISGGSAQDLRLRQIRIENVAEMYVDIGGGPGAINRRILIEDLVVRQTRTSGIACRACFDSVIRRVDSRSDVVDSMESNLILYGGGGNLVEHNTIVTRNEDGCNAIWLVASNYNVIQHNTLDLGAKSGSHIQGSSHNVFTGNVIRTADKLQELAGIEPLRYAIEEPTLIRVGESERIEVLRIEKGSPALSRSNLVFGNEFHLGVLRDNGSGTLLCFKGVGNNYLDGASYRGPNLYGGSCP
ncbi:MAG: right-handed parallel beta-helix repeat-containing protein [Candidatus Alcyoniella australis]|nr:right-handed parallel beta-helix repeat-containing protein [Candidatus Alcyoniella australis]